MKNHRSRAARIPARKISDETRVREKSLIRYVALAPREIPAKEATMVQNP